MGHIFNLMDDLKLWDDTMPSFCTITVSFWANMIGGPKTAPLWSQVAHTPLFIWDPRSQAGERRQQLTQMIDFPANVLEFFGVHCPAV